MQGEIQQRAVGRWYGILSAFGVATTFLRNKHGPCPVCGGRDRFRWDNKDGKGTFYCSQCGAGDGFELLKKLKGWDFKQAAAEVESIVGTVRQETPRRLATPEEQRAAMRKRWKECHAAGAGDPVSKYLERRVGIDSVPSILRSAPDRPAMIALMQAPDGKAAMIHTTFLTEDGNKAPMDNCRLMMPGTIADGSAVRLAPHGDVLGVGEGIETCLSASKLFSIPVWATLSAPLLRKWVPPDQVRKVIICGDNDKSCTGQAAAWHLAHRLAAMKIESEVRIPNKLGHDWNDVLLEEASENV